MTRHESATVPSAVQQSIATVWLHAYSFRGAASSDDGPCSRDSLVSRSVS